MKQRRFGFRTGALFTSLSAWGFHMVGEGFQLFSRIFRTRASVIPLIPGATLPDLWRDPRVLIRPLFGGCSSLSWNVDADEVTRRGSTRLRTRSGGREWQQPVGVGGFPCPAAAGETHPRRRRGVAFLRALRVRPRTSSRPRVLARVRIVRRRKRQARPGFSAATPESPARLLSAGKLLFLSSGSGFG